MSIIPFLTLPVAIVCFVVARGAYRSNSRMTVPLLFLGAFNTAMFFASIIPH